MKKLLVLFLTTALLISTLAGCAGQETPDAPADGTQQTETTKQPALSDVVQKIKDAYGDDYIPAAPIETQQLTDVYALTMDNVAETIAEGPMISVNVDTMIAIKAKDGKGEAVEKELQTYLDSVISNSMQYPMNMAKVQSAKVVRHGDYVFYLMLGAYDDRADVTEEDAAKFAQEQVQKGIDAIANCF